MVRLGSDAFLTELTKLLSRCNASNTGTVQLSFKRYAPNEDAAERAANASSGNSGSSKQKRHSKGDGKASNNKAAANTPHPSTASNNTNTSTSSDAAPTSSSSSSTRSLPSSSEVSPSDEPALLLHARLGSVKLSTVVVGTQHAAKLHRQLSSIITAKASDGLVGGGKGGVGESEAERKNKERSKAAAAARNRQRDEREKKVTAGTASGGQIKRHRQEEKRREGNKRAPHTPSGDVEMKDAK